MAANKLVLIGLLMVMLMASSGCINSTGINSPGDAVKPITIGASDRCGHVADFSSSGPTSDGRTKPTLVAHGVDIISCRAWETEMGDPVDEYYTRASGTSMSTPYAAGAAALLLQANPDLTPAGVKAALTTTAVKLDNTAGLEYEEFYQGTGEIDVYQAYLAANNDSLAGIVPDRWIAGAWTYTGLEYGADRPTKKIYAVTPGGEDFARFVFFTNGGLSGVTISTNGTAGDWITIQPLPGSISANEQKIFDSTLTVPDGVDSGVYTGNITINGNGKSLLSVPITVNIARLVEINNGTGAFNGSLGDNEWKYFYFDIPKSTERIEVSLKDYIDDADLFLFAPTHECIDHDQHNQTDTEIVENPSAGRWMAIVYGKDITSITPFGATVKICKITSTPSGWNPGILKPNETVSQSFSVTNDGIELSNTCLNAIVINISEAHRFNNSVMRYGNVSEYFDVPAGLDRFEVTVRWNNSDSELGLELYDPDGLRAGQSSGHAGVERVCAIRPMPGRWEVGIYGHHVPTYLEPQAFEGVVDFYRHEPCNWISFDNDVIGTLPCNTQANFTATLTVPGSIEPGEHTGAIEISSDQEAFSIPLSFVVHTPVFSGIADHGNDTDGDGLYNYLAVNVNLNATIEQGEYHVKARLEDGAGNYLWANNSIEMADTNQMVQLYFEGTSIWKNRINGTYKIYLYLYSRRGDLLDRGSHTTSYYNYTEFQPLPAVFTDVYTDYGVDTDGDGLYNYLVVDVGVDVTDAGRYKISGRLCECGAMSDLDYVNYDSNTAYLNTGNQTVQLRFHGMALMQNRYDGGYDLRDLCLYNATNPYWSSVPVETPTPITSMAQVSEGPEESMEMENITVLYEEVDHRDIAYTTAYYNYTDFQMPPAEFTGNFYDYGVDTDNDTLYNYLVIDAEINVTKAGVYRLDGDLRYYDGERGRWNCIGIDWNRTYLDAGIQSITIRFGGIPIYRTRYDGSFRTWLNLYETEEYYMVDEMDCSTNDYNYTDFQRPPSGFSNFYADYGEDGDDPDNLYDYLVVNIGVDVTAAGRYEVSGSLYESNSYNSIVYDRNVTYLSKGSQTVQLRFEGTKMRQNEYNGTYDLKYLYLYNSSTGTRLDYINNAYTTSYYNYTDFQTIPDCFNYTKEYVTYGWDAIDTPDQKWTGCDECSYNYVLPWNFTFFCETHSSIQISTNGLITFPPDTSSHQYQDLENTVAIAPFWGDLSQACGEGTNISVQDKGDRVVVVWYTGTCGGGCLDKDLFEAILYENGEIRFNYNYLNNIPHSVGAGMGNGIVYYINTWNDGISVVYSPTNVAETLPGDLNHDGILTPADAAIALQLAASGGWDPAADVNHDSRITSLDALMILQAAAETQI